MAEGTGDGNAVGNGVKVGFGTVSGSAVGGAIAHIYIVTQGVQEAIQTDVTLLIIFGFGIVSAVGTHLLTRVIKDSDGDGNPDILQRLRAVENTVKPQPGLQDLPAGQLQPNGG